MRAWYFYDLKTGLFTGRRFKTKKRREYALRDLEMSTPKGYGAIEGDNIDWRSQKVDINTGQIVDYVPPRPDTDHQWDAKTRRWQKPQDWIERSSRRMQTLDQMKRLEANELRPIREIVLALADAVLASHSDTEEARTRLASIESQIIELRSRLR